MKNVIIYSSHLLPLSQTFILAQAQALKCWQPILIGKKILPHGLPLDGIAIECLDNRKTRVAQLAESIRYWMNRPDPRAVQLFRRHEAQLVHAHFGTDAVEVWPSVKAAGLPMLVTLHGYDINICRAWWEKGYGGIRKRVYPRRLLAMAQSKNVSFIAVSESIRRQAIEYGLPPQKVSVTYIGVDTQMYSPSGLALTQRRKRVLYVGRMVEKKDPLLLIQAFAQVNKRISNAELVMVGDGPLRARAEQLAKELDIPAVFTGALPSSGVLTHLHQARVFCLPSVTVKNGDAEGLPISILEALACGVPVVTSARGGVGEAVVDGRTGFSFPEKDQHRLTSSLHRLLTEDGIAETMSAECRRSVLEKFELASCTQQLERIYSDTGREHGNA